MNAMAKASGVHEARNTEVGPTHADAFEHAAVALSVTDEQGQIVGANRAFFELFGYDRDTQLNVGMLSRPSDRDWTKSYMSRLMSGELEEFRSVKRFIRSDGSEFDGDVAIRPICHGGTCIGMIARLEPTNVRPVVDDARVRKLMQHGPGSLTLIDTTGNVIETSGRYRETLGYPAEFWENRTIIDLVLPEDLPRLRALRDEVTTAPEQVVIADFRVQAADRTIETLEVTALNMVSDPDLAGIVLSTRNVTAERASSRAIAALRDDAVAEAEQRSRLVATVSHELRNPLHAMSGLAELLASDQQLGVDQRELAQSLLRQLHHLTSVTEDLLDAARYDVGRFELRPAPVEVRDVVTDVVLAAKSSAGGRIEVVGVVDDDVPRLAVTDPARIQQVLSNLMGNAVKFTEIGFVKLSVSVGADESAEACLVFEIADTGIGIPEDQIARVFQPFSVATTSGDRRGAGLGLAIVQRLVEALGGSVHLRSRVGEGTVFTIELPFEPAEDESEHADSRIAAPLVRPRILVVEDTPVNQELARHQLDRLEMDCVIAESAEVGLELLDAEAFDVVLMDHQLPGMNGRDATREIRRRGLTVPIVGVTASSTAADEHACLEAGMNAFLSKPVGLERLSAALTSILASAAPARASGGEHATPHDGVEAVDPAVLDQLADELGDRTIVSSLVTTFLDELAARQQDIADGDVTLAARQAHTLKSSARLLGAVPLSEVCAAAETDPAARGLITDAAAAARNGLLRWLNDDPGAAIS